MQGSTLSKITASVSVAKRMAQKALAASPNPQWTEYEMQSVDEWIARQDVKLNRSEAIWQYGTNFALSDRAAHGIVSPFLRR